MARKVDRYGNPFVGLPVLPGEYSLDDIETAISSPPDTTIYPEHSPGSTVVVKDIGPFFEDSGMSDRKSPFGIRWHVQLPWWLGGGIRTFETEDEAVAYVEWVAAKYQAFQDNRLPIGLGLIGLGGSIQVGRHPEKYAPVLEAAGTMTGRILDGIGNIVKGIGEIIPG